MKTIDIKLNMTIDGSFSELILPVESNMKLVDFFIALQLLLKKMSKEATTFDIYDTQFHRIAIIDEELELFTLFTAVPSIGKIVPNSFQYSVVL